MQMNKLKKLVAILQDKEFTLARHNNATVRDAKLWLKFMKLLNKLSPS